MVPPLRAFGPVAPDFDVMNAGFRLSCVARQAAVLRGHTLSIGERLQADVAAFMPHFLQTGTGGAL